MRKSLSYTAQRLSLVIYAKKEGFEVSRFQPLSIEALQRAAEASISELFAESMDQIVRAKRWTLNVKDLHTTIKMKGLKNDLLEDWEPVDPKNSERGRAIS